MANIALTNRCNLSCEYCFAHEYTSSKKNDISKESFMRALDFAKKDGEIGLIGGEPLLHKNINEFLSVLISEGEIRRVTLFTNGIYLDKIKKENIHPKIIFLINVNEANDIGEKQFDKMRENIRELLFYTDEERVTLGVNIYKENQNFSDILSLLREFSLKKVRLSVVIPKDKSEGAFNYFNRMKKTLLTFCAELKDMGISPCYDCNAIPECVYTENEKAFLSSLSYLNEHEKRVFTGKASVCAPIVDIYPDLTASRCFGMSDYKVKIEDFENISDLKNHFFYEIDTKLVHEPSKDECKGCYKQATFGCFGGCLCYKEVNI
ncbi:MAG: radical SAM protein [Clostridia bacterium]|nr:radical SAM protein [Clostridia bacterium]